MKKEEALKRLSSLETETKELRKTIEAADKPLYGRESIQSFEDACEAINISNCVPDFSDVVSNKEKDILQCTN